GGFVPVEVGQASGLLDEPHGVLRPAGFEGLGLVGDQFSQPVGQQDQLFDAFGGDLGRDAHQCSPCIFSISFWTEAARPTPPAATILLAMASARNDLNIWPPWPPLKAGSVLSSSVWNIWPIIAERNEASNFWAV